MMEKKRILLVDDNEAIHLDFRKVFDLNKTNSTLSDLESQLFEHCEKSSNIFASYPSFDIDSVYQGLDAIALVKANRDKNQRYALAFIDMRMPPGIDGVDTIEKLWEIDPDLQVVICTAYSDYSFDQIYQRLKGSDNFLILKKPFDIVEILQLSSSLTKKWELSQIAQSTIDQSKKIIDKNYEELESLYIELKQSQAQIVQQDKLASIKQLAAGVALEINNPIAFVISNNEILKNYYNIFKIIFDDIDKELTQIDSNKTISDLKQYWDNLSTEKNVLFLIYDSSELIKQSLDSLIRVRDIVSDLKTFARTNEAEIQNANINQCLDSTLKILNLNNELKYKCTVIKKYAELPLIRCYPSKLNQVFMNLLVNACQAITEKGQIIITTKLIENLIEITVEDTGSGILSENITKLFDPFFTTKKAEEGTGLGLSISYNIIKEHHGSIKVDSAGLRQGAIFTILLPVTGI